MALSRSSAERSASAGNYERSASNRRIDPSCRPESHASGTMDRMPWRCSGYERRSAHPPRRRQGCFFPGWRPGAPYALTQWRQAISGAGDRDQPENPPGCADDRELATHAPRVAVSVDQQVEARAVDEIDLAEIECNRATKHSRPTQRLTKQARRLQIELTANTQAHGSGLGGGVCVYANHRFAMFCSARRLLW